MTELKAALSRALDGAPISDLRRLTGGSSREIWAFDAGRPLILRRDAPGERRSGGAAIEAEVMAAARNAGVPVPQVLAVLDDEGLIMELVDGETVPRRVLRSESLAGARRGLARQCGEALARLHSIEPPPVVPREDRLATYRGLLDDLGYKRPVLELAYRWLVEHRPPPRPDVLVHGDFRLGNLVVDEGGLAAVLDWESAHAGTPLEDLGWLCVPAWRFRGPLPVGGFGVVDDLLEGYQGAITREELVWAVVLSTWVWAVGCLQQAHRHLSGAQRSVDLAAVGRRVVENEADILLTLHPQLSIVVPTITAGSGTAGYGPPSLSDLLDAVREFLEDDLLPDAVERQRYQLQVVVSILRMAGRELAAPPLGEYGAEGDLGSLAERTARLLAVTNPAYTPPVPL